MAQYIDGEKVFELPKLTAEIVGLSDACIAEFDDSMEVFSACYALAKKCLPAEYLKSKLGGSTIDKVDLIELTVIGREIREAYNESMQAAIDEAIENRQKFANRK